MLLLEERIERVFKPAHPVHDMARVEGALVHYQEQMKSHGLGKLTARGVVPEAIGLEFMKLQYVDSTLWVPMLAIMKDRVKHPTLKKALTDNLLCEAGARHTSHVTICAEFLISKGIDPYFGDLYHYSPLAKHPTEIMNSVIRMSEAEIAGWIMIVETIVPDLFRLVHPMLNGIGANMFYIDEHITVDGDEHGEWMMRSIKDLLQAGTPVDEILHGIHLGGRVALSVPDALYAKVLRGLP
jgi:hypothetical protein